MGAKKIKPKEPVRITKMLVNFQMLKELFPIDWSDKTLKRRIGQGFPAMRDGQDLLFNPQEVMEYFKRQRAK